MKHEWIQCLWVTAAVMGGCAADTGGGGPKRASSAESPPAVREPAEPVEEPANAEPAQPGSRLMGQNEPPQPGPATPPPEAAKLDKIGAPAKPAEWRPTWWIGAPLKQDGRVRVAASADADGVLDVRKAAVAAGRDALRLAAGGEGVQAETLRYTAIRLPDGRYRGFVLMSNGK